MLSTSTTMQCCSVGTTVGSSMNSRGTPTKKGYGDLSRDSCWNARSGANRQGRSQEKG